MAKKSNLGGRNQRSNKKDLSKIKKKEPDEELGIVIPDFVKGDRESELAFLEWYKIGENVKNHQYRWLSIPLENKEEFLTIDCSQVTSVSKKRIKDLPEKTKEEFWPIITERFSIFQTMRVKRGKLRKIWDPLTGGKDAQNSVAFVNKRKADIIELFGQWKSIEDVKRELLIEFGYDASSNELKSLFQANKERIGELRRKWEDSLDDFSLTRKRGRVEKLSYLYFTMEQRYKTNGTPSINVSRELRSILEQIRKEIEGETIKFDINGQIDINATINMNMTVSEISRKVNINQFIIALVAAKRGLDPLKLMNSLAKSYYSSMSGFNGSVENGENIMHPSDLIHNYDWNAIEKKHREGVEDADIIEEKKPSLKNKLKEILENKDNSSIISSKSRK
jgi:hypothetical protein